MCHAGHELWSKSLSVSDVLTCGTVMAGNSCTQFSSGPTLNYANGCDGGSADLVNMYAVDHGLVEGPCHMDCMHVDLIRFVTVPRHQPCCTVLPHLQAIYTTREVQQSVMDGTWPI